MAFTRSGVRSPSAPQKPRLFGGILKAGLWHPEIGNYLSTRLRDPSRSRLRFAGGGGNDRRPPKAAQPGLQRKTRSAGHSLEFDSGGSCGCRFRLRFDKGILIHPPDLSRTAFTDLLPPHGVVHAARLEQRIVGSGLDDPSPLQHVNGEGIGVKSTHAQPVSGRNAHGECPVCGVVNSEGGELVIFAPPEIHRIISDKQPSPGSLFILRQVKGKLESTLEGNGQRHHEEGDVHRDGQRDLIQLCLQESLAIDRSVEGFGLANEDVRSICKCLFIRKARVT